MSLLEELVAACRSDSLSEDGLREIIERRHGLTTTNNNTNISDYLFFWLACRNKRVTEGIIRYLLEYFPDAARTTNDNGYTPLHIVCGHKNVTLSIVQILMNAAPNSIRSVDNKGWMPLHYFCRKKRKTNESVSIEILKLLIEECPMAVRHADNNGFLPLHLACRSKSPAFCRVLIEAYPGSEQISTSNGGLPLHNACPKNDVATVEYLYNLYPDATNDATTDGLYPIYFAISNLSKRENPATAVDVVKFLLGCDPNVKSQKYLDLTLLWFAACLLEYNDSYIEAGLGNIKVIYDAYPEAIEDDEIALHIHHNHEQVQTFINSQLVYSRQAKDYLLMTTPDEKGQLPLHRALQNNVRLGSIKLLVKGNSHAVRNPDHSGALPLHLACQHHESASVVEYLLDLDGTTLRAVDFDNNAALHYACRGAKFETITLLLEKYEAVSVSKRNDQKKLPIDLLLESNEVLDRESVEYTESVFRLLRAYPETVMNVHEAKSGGCSSRGGKKRKVGREE